MLGELLGNHRIVRKLGEGGMGEVYLGEHQGIGTQIAIKVLFPHISTDTAQVDRFFNEARAVAKIRHAGITKITDCGFTAGGRAYLLMEFLEGEPLSERIVRGRLAAAAACEVARQIASVLAATHATGVIHRDLKPDNVFLVTDLELPGGERAKVLDFGIAKLTGDLARGKATATRSQMGTPIYMSPEQWGDASKVDARADIYSLGCMAFEMVCGRPPFQPTSIMEAFALHVQTPPPTARSLEPSVPVALDELLMRMLAKAPADRPQTMIELVLAFAELSEAAGGMDAPLPAAAASVAPRPTPSPQPASTMAATPLAIAASATPTTATPRKRRAPAIAAGAVVVIGGVVTTFMLTRGARDARPVAAAPAMIDAAPVTASITPGAAGAADTTPTSPPPAIDAAPTLRERVEAVDPFVIVGSPPFAAQRGLVSREAYGWYLAELSPSDAVAKQSLKDDGGGAKSAPVTWVTFEQARSFCSAIGAGLPTSAQWAILARERGGPVSVGPVGEWTGPAADGVALVREPRDRADEPDDPLYMTVEAAPGVRAESVAGAQIGFRCVR